MRRVGTALLAVAALSVVQLVFLYYWWVFTDAWPPFVQGRPIDGVLVPLGTSAAFCMFFGAMFRDIGRD